MARSDFKFKVVDGEQVALSEAEINSCVADEDAWAAKASERTIKKTILNLEAEITQRRLREAILGTDNDWLKNKEAEITSERGKL